MNRLFYSACTILFLAIAISASASTEISASASTDTIRLKEHVYFLASDALMGRGFGTSQGKEAAKYIADQMRLAGIQPLHGSYFHPFVHRTGILNIEGINVAGIIEGSDPDLKDQYIVLGAHFDHLGWKVENGDTVVYNGADDNASGTASIIEIGRKLAARSEGSGRSEKHASSEGSGRSETSALNETHGRSENHAPGEAPGRSVILVAFDGEESGLFGSRHFVDDAVVPPEQIALMFSLDMVGMLEANGGLDLHGVELLYDWDKITGEMAAEHQVQITRSNSRIALRTDTAPFGDAGIPSIHAFTGTESPYHQPEDDPDKLDYAGMAKVVDYLTGVTLYLSRVEEISDMQPSEESSEEGEEGKVAKILQPGFRVGLGTSHHNYQEEFYQGKTIFAGEAGFFLQVRLLPVLYLQPEVLYESKGSRHPQGPYRTHAITTPLSLQLSSSGGGVFRSFFHAGGYYTYYFGGTVGGDQIDFQDTYRDQGFGISYGIGFEIMKIHWTVSFRKGLTNILRDDEAGRIVNESIHFSLGYKF